MPQVEADLPIEPASPIDLNEVDENHRLMKWHGMMRNHFPSLSLKVPSAALPVGSVSKTPLGAAELVTIESGPVEVNYRPARLGPASPQCISLMVQRRGTTRIVQREDNCRLSEGDMCLLDETSAFQLVGEDNCGILFLRLPRLPTVSRYPYIDRLFAETMTADDAGTRLLLDTLLRLPHKVGNIAEVHRSAVMGAVIQMLGAAGPVVSIQKRMNWRVHEAINFIDANLSLVGLTAHDVARSQRISRRRLDEIMIEAMGESITGYLWSRRLEQAAADLRCPQRAHLTISQIAFANGFGDAAHFSRAFKRRYLVPPGAWRLN